MRRLFKFRYPKLLALCVAVIAAYILFRQPAIAEFVQHLNGLSYVGIFVAGLLFSFGFTAPFAIGFFLTATPNNIFLAAALGGLGAFLSDVAIFKLIRFSFMDELRLIEHKRLIRVFERKFKKNTGKAKDYLVAAFAGLIIASPLPDELGVSLLAGFSRINPATFAVISYCCNTIGIFVMLLL